jgi:hypothetical protein
MNRHVGVQGALPSANEMHGWHHMQVGAKHQVPVQQEVAPTDPH